MQAKGARRNVQFWKFSWKLRHIALESYEYLKFSNYILVTDRTTRRFLNVINMLIIPSLSIDISILIRAGYLISIILAYYVIV